MGNGGRYLKKDIKPKRGKKIVFIVLGIILVLVIAVVIAGYILLQSMLNRINVVEDTKPSTNPTSVSSQPTNGTDAGEETTATTNPEDTWPEIVSSQNVTNIMVVGQNYREGEESKLSDTMILCSINRETKTLYMTSFMRDLYVPLPAYAGHGPGRNRINVCYNLGWKWTGTTKGGMEMLAMCIEQNFGIPVHHTIEVDFVAFEKIVDLLGGVEVELTEAEAEYLTGRVGYEDGCEPGMQTLDGRQALSYARVREIDGDKQRTNRQRTVIISIIEKCRSMGLMDLYKMAMEILPLITTDMTVEEMNNYIWEFLPMLKGLNIVSQQVPLDKEQLPYSYSSKQVEGIGWVLEPNIWGTKKYLQEQLGFSDAE